MKKTSKIIYLSIFINFILSVIQVMFGYVASSRAVIADGIHAFVYLITSLIAIIGERLSFKKPDRKHPFGYGKVQYLSSIFIGVVIIITGLFLITNVFNVTMNVPNLDVIFIIILIVFIKYILSIYLEKKYLIHQDMIIDTIRRETSSDVLSTLVVLFLLSLTRFQNIIPFFQYLDEMATIILSFMIIRTGLTIIKENFDEIIGENELCIKDSRELREAIKKDADVIEVVKLTTVKYGPYTKLYVDIKMKGTLTLRVINNRVTKIKKEIRKVDKKYKYININVMPK